MLTCCYFFFFYFFFFNDTATTEIYTLSLHDALPISINNANLDFRVNNVRAMRFRLQTDGGGLYTNAPNVIGGSSVNQVNSGVVGATIGGGGGNDNSGGSFANMVTRSEEH